MFLTILIKINKGKYLPQIVLHVCTHSYITRINMTICSVAMTFLMKTDTIVDKLIKNNKTGGITKYLSYVFSPSLKI